jgi:hypothetical protein
MQQLESYLSNSIAELCKSFNLQELWQYLHSSLMSSLYKSYLHQGF